jgi:hypothetical protein
LQPLEEAQEVQENLYKGLFLLSGPTSDQRLSLVSTAATNIVYNMSGFQISDQKIGVRPGSEENLEWLKECVETREGKATVSMALEDFSGMGGLSGAVMKKLRVVFADESEKTYVYKTILERGQERSKNLELAREAMFYGIFASALVDRGVSLPTPVYTHGDMGTGEKTIILDDLSAACVQSGYFFGPGSPHNWGKDLDAVLRTSYETATGSGSSSAAAAVPGTTNEGGDAPWKIPMEVIAQEAFRNAARMHATYWMDRGLLQHGWLRSQAWLSGQAEASWTQAQAHSSDLWAQTLSKIEDGSSGVQWHPLVLQCMNASFAKVSWQAYQQRVQQQQGQEQEEGDGEDEGACYCVDNGSLWTLVHGDFHPANIMWRWGSSSSSSSSASSSASDAEGRGAGGGCPVMLDFEMVGLGSGAQDIAQYLISHMSPADRKVHEMALLRDYYAHLTGGAGAGAGAAGPFVDPARYSFAQCRRDFVTGGTGRWMWMLALLAGMCPPALTQYFHDQVLSFLQDHGVTADNVPMPRV